MEVLKYVCQLAQLKVKIDTYAVSIVPLTTPSAASSRSSEGEAIPIAPSPVSKRYAVSAESGGSLGEVASSFFAASSRRRAGP